VVVDFLTVDVAQAVEFRIKNKHLKLKKFAIQFDVKYLSKTNGTT
jgi:hypothetical protein